MMGRQKQMFSKGYVVTFLTIFRQISRQTDRKTEIHINGQTGLLKTWFAR